MKSEKTKTYLPIEGDFFFLETVGKLVFGSDFFAAHQKSLAAVQVVGGTEALRLAGTFLKQEIFSKVYVSDLTWPNHQKNFDNCHLQVYSYPYYDKSNHCIKFEKLMQFLSLIRALSKLENKKALL